LGIGWRCAQGPEAGDLVIVRGLTQRKEGVRKREAVEGRLFDGVDEGAEQVGMTYFSPLVEI